MEMQIEVFRYLSVVLLVTSILFNFAAGATGATDEPLMGINFGTNGDKFPIPEDVISIYKINGIKQIRLYEPNQDILNALGGTGIKVTLGVKNMDIKEIASSPVAALAWVKNNITPYRNSVEFTYIMVGDDVIPGAYAAYVAQAMSNIKDSLVSVGSEGILVSTTTTFNLKTSYPPSAGAFPPNLVETMKSVTNVLRENSAPLFVSIFPYFAYVSDPKHISLEYATFSANKPVIDGKNQYYSLLEAQIDAYYTALEKIGAKDIRIVVAATGWPTAGNKSYTSAENARTYNQNLVNRIKMRKGTPKVPDTTLDAFIFSLFDENKKPVGVDQHWGVFLPDMDPKYLLLF